MRLPNWIIAGAPKCATSSVFRWLVDHPEVDGSREKETFYFVDPGTHMYRPGANFDSGGLEGYGALFEHCNPDARVILESTPSYLYSQTALHELAQIPSHPQFVFILREPVEQLKSLFSYFRTNWNWIPREFSFRDFITASNEATERFGGNELAQNATAFADYTEHLLAWKRVCGADRIHVFLYEDLRQDNLRFMRTLATQMSIDPDFYDTYDFPRENASYAARSWAIQRLNLALRPLLPKGRVYRGLRSVYRALNTRPAPASEIADLETELELTSRYAPTFDRLESEFGLDLSAWRKAHQVRRDAAAELPPAATPEPLETGSHVSRGDNGCATSRSS